MILHIRTLGLTSLVLGAMGYLMDRPRKRERRALPNRKGGRGRWTICTTRSNKKSRSPTGIGKAAHK